MTHGRPIPGRPGPFGPHFPGTSGPVDRDTIFRNVSGALPGLGPPQNIGLWKSGNLQLSWVRRAADPNNVIFGRTFEQIGVDADTCTARAVWSTPIIDLFPQLGSLGADQTETVSIGPGASVFARIIPTDFAVISDLPSELEVYTMESAHPSDPSQVRTVKARQQISVDFFVGNASTGLMWSAPYKTARYWQVTLIFDWLNVVDLGAPNPEPALELYGMVC